MVTVQLPGCPGSPPASPFGWRPVPRCPRPGRRRCKARTQRKSNDTEPAGGSKADFPRSTSSREVPDRELYRVEATRRVCARLSVCCFVGHKYEAGSRAMCTYRPGDHASIVCSSVVVFKWHQLSAQDLDELVCVAQANEPMDSLAAAYRGLMFTSLRLYTWSIAGARLSSHGEYSMATREY